MRGIPSSMQAYQTSYIGMLLHMLDTIATKEHYANMVNPERQAANEAYTCMTALDVRANIVVGGSTLENQSTTQIEQYDTAPKMASYFKMYNRARNPRSV